MLKTIKKPGFFSSGDQIYQCDLCGRSAKGIVALDMPVWEDYGFTIIKIGITRRNYLVCRSHRDKEILEFSEKVK